MTANTASHCKPLKRSPRKASPASAANAGSRLIKMPNVRVGRRVSAYISNEYGSALDRNATATAAGTIAADTQ